MLEQYMTDVSKYPRCENTATATREELITGNLKLAVKIAGGYSKNIDDLEDYIQAGNIGLMNAAETFDASKGSFSTHAAFHIRAAIRKEIFTNARIVKFPFHLCVKFKQIKAMLANGLTMEEVVEEVGYSVNIIERFLDYRSDGGEGREEKCTGKPIDHDTEIEWAQRELDAALREQPREIVWRRIQGETLAGIGKAMGMTRQRVGQVENDGMAILAERARRYA